VALSVDDPGFFAGHGSGSYGEYPAVGSQELAFDCSDLSKPVTTHIYTINTLSHPSAGRSITVSAQTQP
jgi:hypothetical protein